MKRVTVGAFALILVTGACGGADEGAVSSSPSPKVLPTRTEPAMSLQDSCPKVEAALPDEVLLPPHGEWQQYAQVLSQIAEEGDLETRNAIADLQAAVDKLASDPERGKPILDASQALLGALNNIATRCKAVGSSALQ